MLRRKLQEEPDNSERWLVSYADFITLLFAFFVVMYSISSVNEGKYKVLSETLQGVFNAKQRSLNPIQVGDHIPRVEERERTDVAIDPLIGAKAGADPDFVEGGSSPTEALGEIAADFETEFFDLIFDDKVTIQDRGSWLEISLTNSILFESGGVEPIDSALPVIERIGRIMKDRPNAFLVEGHTDNVPISSTAFPSNWELSAARAASIVRYLMIEGLSAQKMGAIGYGEHRPVVRNDTPDGRTKNRRVVLLISPSSDIRKSILN